MGRSHKSEITQYNRLLDLLSTFFFSSEPKNMFFEMCNTTYWIFIGVKSNKNIKKINNRGWRKCVMVLQCIYIHVLMDELTRICVEFIYSSIIVRSGIEFFFILFGKSIIHSIRCLKNSRHTLQEISKKKK